MSLVWAATGEPLTLQTSPSLKPPIWSEVTNYVTTGDLHSLALDTTPVKQFFRFIEPTNLEEIVVPISTNILETIIDKPAPRLTP